MQVINLGRSAYLGGLDEYPKRLSWNLWFTDDAVGLGEQSPRHPEINVTAIRSLDVYSSVEAKSRLGATLAFGIVGALASKGSKERTIIAVNLRDGGAAYFENENLRAEEARAKLSSWMRAHNVLSSEDARHAELVDGRSDIAGQLGHLGSLHAAGILTDEEFSTAKSRLIS